MSFPLTIRPNNNKCFEAPSVLLGCGGLHSTLVSIIALVLKLSNLATGVILLLAGFHPVWIVLCL